MRLRRFIAPSRWIIAAATYIALLVGSASVVYAVAAAQALPYKPTPSSSDKFDYNLSAVSCPLSLSFPTGGDGDWAASPVAATNYSDKFIEAGWIRFDPDTTGSNSDCINQYCIYTTSESPSESVFHIPHNVHFNGGQRPYFRVVLDHDDLYKWYPDYLYWDSGWVRIGPGNSFSSNEFPEVASGIEASQTDTEIGYHSHDDNRYSTYNSSSLTNWCYSGIHDFGWATGYYVSACSGNSWDMTGN